MRLLAILFIAAGLVAAYILIRDKRQEMAMESWVNQMQAAMGRQVYNDLYDQDPSRPDEANFFKLLSFMRKLEGKGLNPTGLAYDACFKATGNATRSQLVRDTLAENYAMAKKLSLFDDIQNVIKMEQGQAPTILTVEWNNEKMIVGHLVSPSLAPEAANCLANLVLMPEVVYQLQDERIASALSARVKSMLAGGVVGKGSAAKVLAAVKQ